MHRSAGEQETRRDSPSQETGQPSTEDLGSLTLNDKLTNNNPVYANNEMYGLVVEDFVTQLHNSNEENLTKTHNELRILLANARSLSPKIKSLVENFELLNLNAALITESWLSNGKTLQNDLFDLEHGTGLAMICKNRNNRTRVVSRTGGGPKRGGGVAIVFHKHRMNLREQKIPANKYEMVCGSGTVAGNKRRVFLIAVYVPPKTKSSTFSELCECIINFINKMKSENSDPLFMIGGDFNKRDLAPVTDCFPDLNTHDTPPSRGDNFLDLVVSNMVLRSVITSAHPPLETPDGIKSDHTSILTEYMLSKRIKVKWTKYKSRHITKDGEEKFARRLAGEYWEGLYKDGISANEMARIIDDKLTAIMDECFPMRTRKVKDTDPPWITHAIRRLVKKRNEIYNSERKSTRFQDIKRLVANKIKVSKQEYVERVLNEAKENKNDRSSFYKIVHQLKDFERPPQWDIRELFPDESDETIADKVAEYFNKISQEYEPLRPDEHHYDGWKLEYHEVASMLKNSKKPKSQVEGDILPRLVGPNSDLLAIPLTYLYNKIISSGTWPEIWKSETVVTIPKVSSPPDLSKCRNLSCTPYFSKTLERFVFARLTEETTLSNSQFGGRKGCGVDHFIIETWNTVLTDLEDSSAATNVISIDFEKAFNRLDHNKCVEALRAHGASEMTISVVRSFLHERTMRARMGTALSPPRAVPGGSPQGSILGNLLFTLTTDSLTGAPTLWAPPDEIITTPTNAITEIDYRLARVVSPSDSELGINNITVLSDLEHTHTLSFEENGQIVGDIGRSYVQSTPSTRGQFHDFLPPGNLECECLSGTFSSTTGRTFDYMPGMRNNVLVFDTSSEEEFKEPSEPVSGEERTNWTPRPQIQPVTYIDDTNGLEKLNTNEGEHHITSGKQKIKIHAKMSEKFFESVRSKAHDIGMKLNALKTQLLCINVNRTSTVSS